MDDSPDPSRLEPTEAPVVPPTVLSYASPAQPSAEDAEAAKDSAIAAAVVWIGIPIVAVLAVMLGGPAGLFSLFVLVPVAFLVSLAGISQGRKGILSNHPSRALAVFCYTLNCLAMGLLIVGFLTICLGLTLVRW